MNKLKVTHRLMVLVVLPLLAILALLGLALHGFSRIDAGVGQLYDDRVVPLQQLKQISDYYAVNIIDTVNKADHGLLGKQEALTNLNTAQREIDALWRSYQATHLTAEEQHLSAEAAQRFQAANQDIQRAIAFLQGAPEPLQGTLAAFNGPLYRTIDPITASIGSLIQVQLNEAKATRDRAEEVYHRVREAMLAVVGLILLVTVIGGWLVARSVTQPLAALLAALRQAERDADLTARLDSRGRDEISSVAQAYNSMLQRFREAISALQQVTEQVRGQSEELSQVTLKARQDMDRQQSETDQVATATTEMAETIQEVARNAAGAAQAAMNAEREANSGSQIVSRTLGAVTQLSSELQDTSLQVTDVANASDTIGGVLDVIRGIAEQTNLLALNAAIEAARAGEQGRGFAVVADEVRSLAQRTQQSTAEIQQMIERLQRGARDAAGAMDQGQQRARQTLEDAGEADTALRSIGEAVDTIMNMNTQIASATEEQTSVAHEINRNLVNIRDVAQSTQEAVNHIDQSSQALAQIVSRLRELTNRFRVS
ncbi:methyl-accepting chemotaxis protein [Pseudomonas mangiferae]|uniref:Methyl-accepting chemotaxis protein n=1 Tax=Pseudomonas mangiferae TaxID=2593654 RepID=A0A553GWP6_9PSED|nr:methyl-accepting chemotaxis protein [Pseudomonas mangiferae]TRX73927.1 methyl-accepting chemotaxis protein [Pseudomonas mangiferae]